ncbi:MAG: hypothetical protein D6712_04040 [Chloroflexi bacterium]|nr:MAG: hypothetical protein D6712_04040 [Chloroflexota bacterium]
MNKGNRLRDLLVIIASLTIIVLSVALMIREGSFNINLSEDSKLAWHLTRSSGLIAYILLMASTVWGLFISSQFVKDWSPGPISMAIHSTISWLSVLFALGHALLLLLDDYFTYTLGDIFIPFTGPYRPEFVGLGTLAFWLMLVISASFAVKKLIGRRAWKLIHYLSYAGFGMVTAHGLFAGTDGDLLGFRILVTLGVGSTLLLLGVRMGKSQVKSTKGNKGAKPAAGRRQHPLDKARQPKPKPQVATTKPADTGE